jgi:hypothetical protein
MALTKGEKAMSSVGDVFVDDDYYSKLTLNELFREWNESNDAAPARNEIRRRVGWRKGQDILALAIAHLGAESIPFPDSLLDPKPAHKAAAQIGFTTGSHPLPNESALMQISQKLARRIGGSAEVAQFILDSGWDFVDTRNQGQFVRAPHERYMFLEDMVARDMPFTSMSDAQYQMFRGIFNGWADWYKLVV